MALSLLLCATPALALKVRDAAPDFTARAIIDGTIQDLSLKNYRGKWVILLFYPMDFTFVCPTELIELHDHASIFAELHTVVLGISVDSVYAHDAWSRQSRKEGGIGKVAYPLVSDIKKTISKTYQVLIEDEGIALRGTFLIDPKGVLRQMSINDLPVGRNVDEFVRMIKAFQFVDTHGTVCPSRWKGPESSTITPDPVGKKHYFETEFLDREM